ncbi:FAD/FMN-containing dehydrogenase [gamma proteobacterium HdN1]|nr:FAD/FMN-containing dehydrogenase [gamma proteobacterium HdN1]
MRRWNGWGNEGTDFPLKPAAKQFLSKRIGEAKALPDASLEDALTQVPASRLPPHSLIQTAAEVRLRHARGQSFGDWLAMRSGQFGVFPDGVAFPNNAGQVRELLQFALQHNVEVIPYGGGSSVVGHINPRESERPVLTISLTRMNRLSELDRTSQIATFGAGTAGPEVESQLKPHGYMLGHFPQSWELSTVGGWVASRSSGQQSLRYGRIEQLFAGGSIETTEGTLEIPSFPASSAGPDIREMILGSEGRMGIITDVKLRVSQLPEQESFHVGFVPNWSDAIAAARTLVQNRIPLSMLRISNEVETETQVRLATNPAIANVLDQLLKLRGAGSNKCMITFGVTGTRAQCNNARRQALNILSKFGVVNTGTILGKKWEENRFKSPYLRHGLWTAGYAVDTLETACDWSRIPQMVENVEASIKNALSDKDEQVHVFTHLSHVYSEGSSAYTTYVFRCADSYEETEARWRKIKTAASNAIVANGGTISHQHGVGTDHAPFLEAEKKALGMSAIRSLCDHFDPAHIMNPGKLLED